MGGDRYLHGDAVIALLIMVLKAIFCPGWKKASAFLTQIERLTGDATALDKPEAEDEVDDLAEVPSMTSMRHDKRFGLRPCIAYHSGFAN